MNLSVQLPSLLSIASQASLTLNLGDKAMPSVHINLAHIYMTQGQFVSAQKLYASVSERYFEVSVLSLRLLFTFWR